MIILYVNLHTFVGFMFISTEPKALDKNFSNGYLFGELLFKYQLQKDFTMFTNNE